MAILGYKTADVAEANEFFHKGWMNYIYGKSDIKTLIKLYDEQGFEVSSDLPFNGLALEAFREIKNCKIILTVRDNEDVWLKSYQSNLVRMATRHGIYGGIVESALWCSGFGGSWLYNSVKMCKYIYRFVVNRNIS